MRLEHRLVDGVWVPVGLQHIGAEDPTDPGTFGVGGYFTEDPNDPGTYLIAAAAALGIYSSTY